jgi:hypothetical protein
MTTGSVPVECPARDRRRGAWPTFWIVCAYATAALAGSAWVLHRRDA